MSAGSFAGSIAAGWLSDILGRRGALMIASLVWIVGAMVQCSAQNVTHLVAGRVVSGLAVGVTSSQTCVYLSELAPARIRGRVVGIQQWAIEWGILIMYLIAYGCAVGVSGPAAFRICWGIQAVPGVILFIALFFFPESPRWLAGKERWEEALETLALIHGNGNRNDPVVQVEFEEVQEAARVAHQAKDVSFFALFGPRVWKRTMCGMSVQIWQQLLGGNVAMYYVVYIFEMAGMVSNSFLYTALPLLTDTRRLETPPCGHQPFSMCSSSLRQESCYHTSIVWAVASCFSSALLPAWLFILSSLV
jgi:MFS family permease